MDIRKTSFSSTAVREFIGSNVLCLNCKARIVVKKNGNTVFNEVFDIVVTHGTNEVKIEIIAMDTQFYKDYYIYYSNRYQEFNYMNDVLWFKCQNRDKENIEIEITKNNYI